MNGVTLDPIHKQAALNIFGAYTYGDVIPISVLEKELDIRFPPLATRKQLEDVQLIRLSRIEALKNELLTNHKMALRSLRGEGYRVVPPREHVVYAKHKLTNGISKAIRTSTALLVNTADNLLTLDELRVHRETHGKIAAFASLTKTKLLNALD